MTLAEAVHVFDSLAPIDAAWLTIEGEQIGVPHCCSMPVLQNGQDGDVRIYCENCRREIRKVAGQWIISSWGDRGINQCWINGEQAPETLPPDPEPSAEAPKMSEVQELRLALRKAVDLIHTWHNMTHVGPPANARAAKMMEHAWELYKDHSPEMELIRKALGGEL